MKNILEIGEILRRYCIQHDAIVGKKAKHEKSIKKKKKKMMMMMKKKKAAPR